MRIFNSYNNQLEDFKTIHKNQLNMYVCGPTVYNYIHIGNARPVVFFDTVRRYFEAKGYQVTYVSNFTDVDDKIIQKALSENKDEMTIANRYIDAYLKDSESLNCLTDYIKPRVTDYMNHIIDFIQSLIDKDYAYIVDGDVYFRVEKVKDYGHLSNRHVEDLKSGARIDINPNKESPLDFTLWKRTDEGIQFDAPFSTGRPGWHTECVAMIDDIFGQEIDIHGGGSDLKFPHHENEIAQSIALNQHRLANYWVHNGRLSLKESKMSKSLGNVILVKDVEDKMALRYFLLSTHYRSPLNYDDDSFQMYVKEFEKLDSSMKQLHRKLDLSNGIALVDITDEEIKALINAFDNAMAEDFNTANAITALQSLIKRINVSVRQHKDIDYYNQLLQAIVYMTDILGLNVEIDTMSDEDRELYQAWQDARKAKNFEKADQLRTKLTERGIL
ncbi:MAG TPA: cysteine--tRNA ligase [Candidatus Izemoplasmatales bacterium]|nr:cysteine--tRNA ligase [Candidatus Izemoplasmatales bacterium]